MTVVGRLLHPSSWISLPGPLSLGARMGIVVSSLAVFLLLYVLIGPTLGAPFTAFGVLILLGTGYLLGLGPGLLLGGLYIPMLMLMEPALQPEARLGGANTGLYVSISTLAGLFGGIAGALHTRGDRARAAMESAVLNMKDAQRIAHMGYWQHDRDGTITWSPELLRLYGLRESPKTLEEVYERMHPDDRDEARAVMDDLWEGGGPYSGERRAILPDGTVRTYLFTASAAKDRDGNVHHILGTTQDITSRSETEERMRVSEARLNEAQRVAKVGSWELDLVRNHLWWSDENFRLFGFRPGEFQENYEAFLEAIHPDDRQMVADAYEASVANRTTYSIDHRLLLKDGTIKWVHERGETFYDGDTPVRSVGTTQDITERKKAEAADHVFRTLIDRMDDIYWFGDLELNEFTFSGPAEALFGRPPEELRVDPASIARIFHPDDAPRFQAMMAQLLETGFAEDSFRIQRPAGDEREIHAKGWKMNEHAPNGASVCGVIRDITAEKEVVRMKELDEMKALFMNAAAHELNTPLTPLKLQVAVLRKQHPDNRSVGIVARNVKRMERLVTDLLDASRLQAGRLKYAVTDGVDLSALLNDVSSGAAIEAAEAGIEWQEDIEDGLQLRADSVRLEQVMHNLVSNALKFTPAEGRVRLSAHREGDDIVVRAQDSGLGMTAEQMAGLFVPFQQFHRGKTGTHQGTGLGLFISQGIVEFHDGRIHAESEGEGKGTTFTVTLPVAGNVQSFAPGKEP